MSVYVADPDLTIWHGDALAILRELPDGAAHACVTSPPYLDGLASYCKDCDREHMRAWYLANREKATETSRRWVAANPLARRGITQNWYGLSRDPEGERIDYVALMETHGWTCHICGDAIAGIDDLSFDHVVPFIAGGRHVAANVRPAHLICNARKGQREGQCL